MGHEGQMWQILTSTRKWVTFLGRWWIWYNGARLRSAEGVIPCFARHQSKDLYRGMIYPPMPEGPHINTALLSALGGPRKTPPFTPSIFLWCAPQGDRGLVKAEGAGPIRKKYEYLWRTKGNPQYIGNHIETDLVLANNLVDCIYRGWIPKALES